MKQHFVDARGVNRVMFAQAPQSQQPRPSAVSPVASRPAIEVELQDAEVAVRESSDSPSAEVEMVEVDKASVGTVVASAEIPKSVLPEILRVQEYFER